MNLVGQSYALYSNGDAAEAHDNIIARMNSNFTDVEEVVYTFPGRCQSPLYRQPERLVDAACS